MFKRLRKKDDGPAPFLIIGLGNPGPDFKENRHNVGFMVLDQLADQLGERFGRVQAESLVASARHSGERLVLAKPRTFMNPSGRAVSALARFYKVMPEHILVIYDDADLPFESLRMRPGGGAAGQKGMRSIIQSLGTQDFPRLRVGIGRPPGRMRTPDYVLQDFSKQQREVLPFVLRRAADAALTFVSEGIDAAMNEYNGAEG
ncbi:MAG: aminoacyl-tRNA hydrolase [Chloroflexi bacterium]|nr:aminoacyl-tRNA hydrolase [Chloroflexota bacterium]MQC26641.1 aminoacyl-tRNA hydrolase [Chloroflexota bacterium]